MHRRRRGCSEPARYRSSCRWRRFSSVPQDGWSTPPSSNNCSISESKAGISARDSRQVICISVGRPWGFIPRGRYKLIVRRFVLFPSLIVRVSKFPFFENGPPMIAPASLPKYPVKSQIITSTFDRTFVLSVVPWRLRETRWYRSCGTRIPVPAGLPLR